MRKLSPVLSLLVVAGWASSASAHFPPGSLIFDSIDGPAGVPPYIGVSTATNSSSQLIQAYTGMAFNFGNVNKNFVGGLQMTGMDLILGEVTTADYADVQVNIQFYNTFTGATPDNPSAIAFTDPVANPLGGTGPTWVQDLGAVSAASLIPLSGGSAAALERISFVTPSTPNGISIANLSNLGVVMSFSETTTPGGPLTTSGQVTAGVRNRELSPFAIGTNAALWQSRGNNYLYFRNADGNGSFNMVGGDANDFANPPDADLTSQFYSGSAIAIFGQGQAIVPEPSSADLALAGLAAGLGALLVGRRRRRSVESRDTAVLNA